MKDTEAEYAIEQLLNTKTREAGLICTKQK